MSEIHFIMSAAGALAFWIIGIATGLKIASQIEEAESKRSKQ